MGPDTSIKSSEFRRPLNRGGGAENCVFFDLVGEILLYTTYRTYKLLIGGGTVNEQSWCDPDYTLYPSKQMEPEDQFYIEFNLNLFTNPPV